MQLEPQAAAKLWLPLDQRNHPNHLNNHTSTATNGSSGILSTRSSSLISEGSDVVGLFPLNGEFPPKPPKFFYYFRNALYFPLAQVRVSLHNSPMSQQFKILLPAKGKEETNNSQLVLNKLVSL
jgi:hypothetical protein